MAGLGKPIMPEDTIIRGLILDSKDLFSREAYEQRIDKELAKFIVEFRKNRTIDANKVREKVEEFIAVIEKNLERLEDAKRRAVQEEYLKLDKIRKLLIEGRRISSKELKKELEKFSEAFRSNTVAVLRYNRRREKRLRREKAPFGFVMKKLASDRYLDAEVAKKAFRLGEHTLKEPQLLSEVDYLASILNKNPNEKALAQLKERIHRLIKDYESDLDDFLTIEVDIDLEEARKLHRIDHYITFLKMIGKIGNFNDLIEKLGSLKKLVDNWVYQDTINAKKLEQYAVRSFEYGQRLLESSQTELGREFPEITIEKHIAFEEVPGLLMYNKNKPTNRGIVLVHGVFGTKETLLTLGKRLATQDFAVFAMDIAQHGENINAIRLGLISEQILMAVSFLRRRGIRNIGVIGHSLGAICTLFAIAGYNIRIEKEFFDTTAKLMQKIEKMESDLNKQKKKGEEWKQYFFEKAKYDLIQLSEEYKKLKEIILNGLREMYEGNSRIDAAVLLAPPKTCQFFIPTYLSGAIKRLPKITRKPVAKLLSDVLFFKEVEKVGETSTIPEYVMKGMNEQGKIRIVGGDVTDWYNTFDYAQKVKNPYDYMDAIKKICKQFSSPDKRIDFIRYYVNLIRKTPKLYIYGLGDIEILKSFIPRMISKNIRPVGRFQITELEDHYRDYGGKIIRIPNLNHTLTLEGNLAVYDAARMPKITYKIVTFFNQCLGRGRLV